ncbi:MAG: protein-S-isoprenylcysteine O-methyltransferase [Planctomycetota bacterium]
MLKGHNTFEVIFLVGFVVGSVIRKIFTVGRMGAKAEKKCSDVPDIILVAIAGVGLAMPLLYFLTPWLDFANYSLPGPSGWVGTVVFAGGVFMLWRSHADLGRNWSATLRITGQHSLVTGGVYRRIRHPMYTAHLLWAIAQGLMLSNWIAGWSFLLLSVPLYLMRIPKEEQMMLEQFGAQYRTYMNRTGRLIPRIRK